MSRRRCRVRTGRRREWERSVRSGSLPGSQHLRSTAPELTRRPADTTDQSRIANMGGRRRRHNSATQGNHYSTDTPVHTPRRRSRAAGCTPGAARKEGNKTKEVEPPARRRSCRPRSFRCLPRSSGCRCSPCPVAHCSRQQTPLPKRTVSTCHRTRKERVPGPRARSRCVERV